MKVVNRKSVVIFATMTGLTACSTGHVRSTEPLDLSEPSSIGITIETDNPNLQTNIIQQNVGKNLADWDYPIATTINLPISHKLNVLVGTAERGSTPAGFSFSIGNSDPRALDFQKADILPITCKLSPVNQPKSSVELSMGFSDSEVNGPTPNLDELANHISTVCFNLLQEVNWPVEQKHNEPNPARNSWLPEIRIEQEAPESELKALPHTDSAAVPGNDAVPQNQNRQKVRQITKEISKEGRKVYIIHNQSHPITFKFGHERK